MTRRLVSGVVVGALAAAFAGSLAAQPVDPKGYVPGVAGCNVANCGYVLSASGHVRSNNVVRSAAYNGARGLSGNLCYRTGYWAPSMAIEACDPDLVPKPPPPPPPPPRRLLRRRPRRRRRRRRHPRRPCRRSRWRRRRCSISTRPC